MKPFDYLAIAFAAVIIGWFSLRALSASEEGSQVRIQTPQTEFVYPLDDQPREIEVEGPLGITYIEMEGGRVRVIESPCREKVCIAGGWIAQSGEWIACLPNRIFLRIEGGTAPPVDAQTF